MARGHRNTSKPKNKLPGKGTLRMQFSYTRNQPCTYEDLKTFYKVHEKMLTEGPAEITDPAKLKMMEDFIAGKPVYLKRPVVEADFVALLEAGLQRVRKDLAAGRVTQSDLYNIKAGKVPKKLGVPPTSGPGSPGWDDKLLEASDGLQKMIEAENEKRQRQLNPSQSPGPEETTRKALDRLGEMIDAENKARERRLKQARPAKPPKPPGAA